jgi:Zn-dependent protease with chaperone function
MTDQNFANHKRNVPGFHFVLTLLLTAGFILAIVNIVKHWQSDGLLMSLLILLIFACMFFMFWFIRAFPIKAQDRAIRAEESLRYFILTRQPLPTSLTIGQIAALRFAPDDELLPLVEKTMAENLQPDDIKKAIKNWKADYHRV